MTLQQLRYIVTLVQVRNFSQAAKRCFVSQSTISIQLKKLENSLGVKLFDRSLRHVKPTPACKRILPYARAVLAEVEFIDQVIEDAKNPTKTLIKFGAIPTLGPYYLPHLIVTLRQKKPNIRVFLQEGKTNFLLESLEDGSLDVALLALPVRESELAVEKLFDEYFVCAAPADNPLSKKKEINPADLEKENLLLLEEGHCLRDQALEFCGPPHHLVEGVGGTSLETLKRMVEMGIGVTVLPSLAVPMIKSEDSSKLVIRPFRKTRAKMPKRTIGLVWRHGSLIATTIKEVVKILKKQQPKGTQRVS